MSYFDLDPVVEANILGRLGTIKPGDMGPGAFSGSLTATGKGLLQNVATPAALLADAATPTLRPIARSIDQIFGGTTVSDWLDREQQKTRQAVADLMPGPETGFVGQLGFGFSQIVPQAVAGMAAGGPAGAAALPGALQGYQATIAQEAQGVDKATAAGVGLITGATTAVGVALPATFGGSYLATAAIGGGANAAQGIVQRGATSALLENNGYADMAKQYKAFDLEAIAIDATLGIGLGALALRFQNQAARANIPPSAIDDALLQSQRQHADVPTAPGVPVDPASRTAHSQALNKAVDDLVNDRPVDVSTTPIQDAEFLTNRAELQAAVEAAVVDLSPLGKLLNEVDTLRAEVEALGITPADDPLFTGRAITDAPRAAEAPAARDLPGAVQGRAGEVFVGDRAEPVRFMVMEARDLSAAVGKADNQFRDRTRVASQLQIAKIANNLQFGRLGEAPTMAEGAPTLAQDGRIVGGNGRVLAVQRAYEQGSAEGYRASLAERAAEFGLTREQIEGMQQPVLVRQFTNPVNVRRAAILSNEGGALRMSALEQAKVDAERMPSLSGVEMPESGDFTAASMRDFVRQWLSGYPDSERSDFVRSDGALAPAGQMRMRNAILHEAYGDSPTLERLIESTDERQKNIAAALVRAAPNVAEARSLIETGALHDLDVQPHLLEAVDISRQLRADGIKLEAYLDQKDAFADPIGPETVAFLRHFEQNPRSQRAIADAITGYYDAVRALGDPRQASMFDAQAPSRVEVLRGVLEGKRPEAGDGFDVGAAEAMAAPPVGKWYTGSPEAGRVESYDLASQSARANAEAQKAGPGQYITQSRDMAGTYGGRDGRLYEVEDPFSNPFDFNTVDPVSRKSGETRYKEMVQQLGGRAAANARLAEMGYDAITFTDSRGTKIANIFNRKTLKDVGPARPESQAPRAPLSLVDEAPPRGVETTPETAQIDAAHGVTPELKLEDLKIADTQVAQIMESTPNFTALLDNGETIPAGVAIQQADAIISTTQADSAAYPAAVACALRG